MTNSHVVEDGESVLIRTEQTQNVDLKANVIGICPRKDLALIELDETEIKKLNPFYHQSHAFLTIKIFEFNTCYGCRLSFRKENLKFTGVLSGNQNEYDIDHDAL